MSGVGAFEEFSSSPIYWPPTPPRSRQPGPSLSSERRFDEAGTATAVGRSSRARSSSPKPSSSRGVRPPERKVRAGVLALRSESAPVKAPAPAMPLSGREQRLKDIAEALGESMNGANRTSLVARTRSLPSNAKSSVPNAQRLAPVFLSEEQKYILKLVQGNTSLFYTGSAGPWPLSHLSYRR